MKISFFGVCARTAKRCGARNIFFDKRHFAYNFGKKFAGPYSHNWNPHYWFYKKMAEKKPIFWPKGAAKILRARNIGVRAPKKLCETKVYQWGTLLCKYHSLTQNRKKIIEIGRFVSPSPPPLFCLSMVILPLDYSIDSSTQIDRQRMMSARGCSSIKRIYNVLCCNRPPTSWLGTGVVEFFVS